MVQINIMADEKSQDMSPLANRSPGSDEAALQTPSSEILLKPDTKLPTPTSAVAPTVSSFPPPKTDKPRPHVCTTCMRSFARLEHLKRHERSHTKEKPFECPSCTRCFARRDLLLRHQQKLHSTTTPSSRPRAGRRESTTGVATGRVRKSSVASATAPVNMRPRANTLSHVDSASLGSLTSGAFGRQYAAIHGQNDDMGGISSHAGFGLRNIGTNNNAIMSGLPRIETSGLSIDLSGGLRTAPILGSFGTGFDMGNFGFEQDGGDTINPHALHVHSASFSVDNPWDLSHQMYSGMASAHSITEDNEFEWMAHGFENQMTFMQANDNAIDDSSPSAMSTNSPATFQDQAIGGVSTTFPENHMAASAWSRAIHNGAHLVHSPVSTDAGPFYYDMGSIAGDTVSPKSLERKGSIYEHRLPTPLEMPDPATMAAMSNGVFPLPFKNDNNAASTASTASIDSSLRHSSIATSSELINDHMRNILVARLAQSPGFGQRKQSQPAISSPLSPSGGTKGNPFNAASFPSTQDLQRYISAYIKYFHPHLPFLHIPSLNFDSNEYVAAQNSNGYARHLSTAVASGGSCLVLSVAAMGALYENEVMPSKELFECAKKLLSHYLEDRRRSQLGKSQFLPQSRPDREDTPLWLVQAMLLNVIYGHNCGDKQAADIASNHCAALVSLARGAELAKPYPSYLDVNGLHDHPNHPQAQPSGTAPDAWSTFNPETNDSDWYEWKVMEERKRTLYAVFVLSSMLVTAYNRAPALTNSEIRLNLPCDEELWAADSAQSWRALGGAAYSESRAVLFPAALTHLLRAADRQQKQLSNGIWEAGSVLRPSSFGCLVLINALHNYIWETRQRHLGRQWTVQEIESMHAHIEPALRAWQAAWRSNPTHAVERPNPFGAGPLSADSIPLLDLAYVRLFVDFGRSKEAYWQRDYDAMAQELAKGPENMATFGSNRNTMGPNGTQGDIDGPSQLHVTNNLEEAIEVDAGDGIGTRVSQREQHLRKAAFYAADHLIASDRLGLGLDERNMRELPIQSVLCACDSAQVLAEWVTTLQERVGKYVGVLGRDNIDLLSVPSMLLMDDEDRKLLSMIEELLSSVESCRVADRNVSGGHEGGYGSRILVITAQSMAQAAVWPVTKLMGRSLETQAGHIRARVYGSLSQG